MLTAIIPTFESERALVPTLAALVSGAVEGMVSEVIVADGGSTDATAEVANHAGCNLMVSKAPLGTRLREASSAARAPWLLFLQPGVVPDATWTNDVSRFIEEADVAADAAAFRRSVRASRSPVVDALRMLMSAFGASLTPAQGILISKTHYLRIGGHRDVADSEADLVKRLGRRVMLLDASVR